MEEPRPPGYDWLADDGSLYDRYNSVGSDEEDDDGSAGAGSDMLRSSDYEGLEALGRQKNFKVLSKKDISQRQVELISKASGLFLISWEEACFLLHQYEWDIQNLSDSWFDDESGVRSTGGLLKNREEPGKDEVLCRICFTKHKSDLTSSVGCDHFYCHECWEGYLRCEISDGPKCLSLRCPDPSCNAMVHQGIINKLAKDEEKQRYAQFVLAAYVESREKNIKWCPAPNCEYAIEFLGEERCDVLCDCKIKFCWECTEEAHRPVNCATVAKWNSKNIAASGTMDWIKTKTKLCPQCNKLIFKDGGCMHVICSSCRYHFCWLCSKEYIEHTDFFACNSYDKAKEEDEHFAKAEAEKENLNEELEKYNHYYSRWWFHHESRKKAQENLEKAEEHMSKLANVYQTFPTKLSFISKAWEQIIECRLILKWTYVYGYYLEDESKIELFEFQQGEAEAAVERIHQCAEGGLKFTTGELSKSEFEEFQVKLTGHTSATRKVFEKFVETLEAELDTYHSKIR